MAITIFMRTMSCSEVRVVVGMVSEKLWMITARKRARMTKLPTTIIEQK